MWQDDFPVVAVDFSVGIVYGTVSELDMEVEPERFVRAAVKRRVKVGNYLKFVFRVGAVYGALVGTNGKVLHVSHGLY